MNQFHIQLCFAIFFMLFFFLVGIERTEHPVSCTIFSLVIQYFTLASVAWMGAEAVLMFVKLVFPFKKLTTKHRLLISIIAWCKYSVIVSDSI